MNLLSFVIRLYIYESRWEVEKIDSKENFIRIVNQYQNLIFSICLKLTGDYFAAEDLTQETFLAAFRHFEEFDGGFEKAWLARIAVNKCTDYNRAAARRMIPTEESEIPMQQTGQKDDPLEQVMNREILRELEANCKALSPPYQDVALQHFVQGKTAIEIADGCGDSVNTVKTRIRRARDMLKKTYGKEMLKN